MAIMKGRNPDGELIERVSNNLHAVLVLMFAAFVMITTTAAAFPSVPLRAAADYAVVTTDLSHSYTDLEKLEANS